MADIGPGPLMCIRTTHCSGCGEGVDNGRLYQCTELIEPGFIALIVHGPCGCGDFHPYVALQNHSHAYCPACFVPLGDPDAEVKETEEPSSTKRREDDGYNVPAPVKETENV